MSEARLNVFEITNDGLRERYVSVSPLSLDDLLREHRHVRPARIAHWAPPMAEHYRIVEAGLRPGEAVDFVERYAEVMRQSGFRTILDLPARYTPPPPFDQSPS